MAIFGPFFPPKNPHFWPFFGLFWPKMAIFDHFLTIFGDFWRFLGGVPPGNSGGVPPQNPGFWGGPGPPSFFGIFGGFPESRISGVGPIFTKKSDTVARTLIGFLCYRVFFNKETHPKKTSDKRHKITTNSIEKRCTRAPVRISDLVLPAAIFPPTF